MTLRVLLVDDEPAIVDALKKALRRWRDRLEVDGVVGGRAAVRALDEVAYDVVITDARMPEVDGEAVLTFARTRRPATLRLVLSGQVDARTAHRLALIAHQFLPKPTTAPALVAAIDDGQQLLALLADESTRAAVLGQRSLPVPPRVYQRICSLCESQTASLDAVADTVLSEPAIAASVLRLANSAFYGASVEVASVAGAVRILGLARLRELVLVAELFAFDDPLGLLDTLSARCVQRAKAARLLTAGTPLTELASEGALLSEVGVHVLISRDAQAYRSVWDAHARGDGALAALERPVFGTTHGEVGAVLLGLWRLPQALVNVVRYAAEVPGPDALLDARTAVSLVVQAEGEASLGGPSSKTEALAVQLGVAGKLPALWDVLRAPSPLGALSREAA